MAAAGTKTLHDVVSEALAQGAFGPNALESMAIPSITEKMDKVIRSRWDCPVYLEPSRTLEFDTWAGGKTTNYVGSERTAHSLVRAAQCLLIHTCARKIRKYKSVVVLWTTWGEARQLRAAAPGVRFRFVLGGKHPKDASRLSKGVAEAELSAEEGDEFALDFCQVVNTRRSGRFFQFADTVEDLPVFPYRCLVAFDSLYEVGPRAIGEYMRLAGIQRGYFTMHTAAELDIQPKVPNPVFSYSWERRGHVASMVFSDSSQPYVHNWKSLKSWWLHAGVDLGQTHLVWETVHFNSGYGLFEMYLEPARGIVASPAFFACQGKVQFIVDVLRLFSEGVYAPIPVMVEKYLAVRLYVLAVLDQVDPNKIVQNIRSNTSKIVVGNRTLSAQWDLMDQDVTQILMFIILHTSLERMEIASTMVSVGKLIRRGGFEENFYSPWVQAGHMSATLIRWLRKTGVLPARILERLRAHMVRPMKVKYQHLQGAAPLPGRALLRYDVRRALEMRGELPPWAEVGDVRPVVGGPFDDDKTNTVDREAFEAYKRDVLQYSREVAEDGTHGAAKLMDTFKVPREARVYHFGVEPGGMLKLLARLGYTGYAFAMQPTGGGRRQFMVDPECFRSFPIVLIDKLNINEPQISSIDLAGETCFLFDNAHCDGCAIEEELVASSVAIIARLRPTYFMFKVLSLRLDNIEALLNRLPHHYEVTIERSQHASPMSYEFYVCGEPAFGWWNAFFGRAYVMPKVQKIFDEVYTNWSNYQAWRKVYVTAPTKRASDPARKDLDAGDAKVEVPDTPKARRVVPAKSDTKAPPPLSAAEKPLTYEAAAADKDFAAAFAMIAAETGLVAKTAEVPADTPGVIPPTEVAPIGEKVVTGAAIDVTEASPLGAEVQPEVTGERIVYTIPAPPVPPKVSSALNTPILKKKKVVDEEKKIVGPLKLPTRQALADALDQHDPERTMFVTEGGEVKSKHDLKALWAPLVPEELHFCEIEADGFCVYRALSVLAGRLQEDWKVEQDAFNKAMGIQKKDYVNGWIPLKTILTFCEKKKLAYIVFDLDANEVTQAATTKDNTWFGTLCLTVKGSRAHADVATNQKHPYIRKTQQITMDDMIWHDVPLFPKPAEALAVHKSDLKWFMEAMANAEDNDIRAAHKVVVERLNTLKFTRREAVICFVNGKAGVGKSNFPKKYMERYTTLYITATRANMFDIRTEFLVEHDIPTGQRDDYFFKTMYMAFTSGTRLPAPQFKTIWVDECCRNPFALVRLYAQAFPTAKFILMGDPQQMSVNPDWFPDMQGFISVPDYLESVGIDLASSKDAYVMNVSRRFGPGCIRLLRDYCPQVKMYCDNARVFTFTLATMGNTPAELETAEEHLNMVNEKRLLYDAASGKAVVTVCSAQGMSKNEVFLLINIGSANNFMTFRDSLYVALSRARSSLVIVELEKTACQSFASIKRIAPKAPPLRKRQPMKVVGKKKIKVSFTGGLLGSNMNPGNKQKVMWLGGSLNKYAEMGLDVQHIQEVFSPLHPVNRRPTPHVFSKLGRAPPISTRIFTIPDIQKWNSENPEAVINDHACMEFRAPRLLDCTVYGDGLLSKYFTVKKPVAAVSGKRHYTKSMIQAVNTFAERYSDTVEAMAHQARTPTAREMKSPAFLSKLRDDWFKLFIDPEKYETFMNAEVVDSLVTESWNEYTRVVKFDKRSIDQTMSTIRNTVNGHLKQQTKPKGLEASYKDKGGQPVAASEKGLNAMFSLAVRFVRAIIANCFKDEWMWADGKSAQEVSDHCSKFMDLFAWMGDSVKFDATHSKNTRPVIELIWLLFTFDPEILRQMLSSKDGRRVYVHGIMMYLSQGGQDSGGTDTMLINISFSTVIVVLMIPKEYMRGGVFLGDDWVVYSPFYVIPFTLKYYNAWFLNPIKIIMKSHVAEFCNYLFGYGHHCYNPLVLVQKLMIKNYNEVLASPGNWAEWAEGVRDLCLPYRKDFFASSQLLAAWSGLDIEDAQEAILSIDSYPQVKYARAKELFGDVSIYEDVTVGGSLFEKKHPHQMDNNANNTFVFQSSPTTLGGKNELQEYLVAQGEAMPVYSTTLSGGTCHAPSFTSVVTAVGISVAVTKGPNKIVTEKYAAAKLLELLKAATPRSVVLEVQDVQDALDALNLLEQFVEAGSGYAAALARLRNKLMHALNGNTATWNSSMIPNQPGVYTLGGSFVSSKGSPLQLWRNNGVRLFKDATVRNFSNDENCAVATTRGNVTDVCVKPRKSDPAKSKANVIEWHKAYMEAAKSLKTQVDTEVQRRETLFDEVRMSSERDAKLPPLTEDCWQSSVRTAIAFIDSFEHSQDGDFLIAARADLESALYEYGTPDTQRKRKFKQEATQLVLDEALQASTSEEAAAREHNKVMHSSNGNPVRNGKRGSKEEKKVVAVVKKAVKQAHNKSNRKGYVQPSRFPSSHRDKKGWKVAVKTNVRTHTSELTAEARALCMAISNPMEMQVPRLGDIYSTTPTCVGNPFWKLSVPWIAATTPPAPYDVYPPFTDSPIFAFRDPLRAMVIYDVNRTALSFTYDAYVLAGTASNAFAPTAPSVTGIFQWNTGETNYIPISYMLPNSSFQPHGAFLPMGRLEDHHGKWVWLDEGATVSFSGSTPAAASTGILVADYWGGGEVQAAALSAAASIATTSTSLSLPPVAAPGYYSIGYQPASDVIFHYGGMSYTQAGGPVCRHYCCFDLETNLLAADAIRVTAVSIRYMNKAPTQYKQGSITALQCPQGDHWFDYIMPDNTAYEKLAGSPGAYTEPIDNGFYGFLKPSSASDFTYQVPYTTARGFIRDTFYELRNKSQFLTAYPQIEPGLGQSADWFVAHGIEYQTKDSWRNARSPPASEAAMTAALVGLRNVKQFHENPIHLSEIWDNIKSVIGKGASLISQYGPGAIQAARTVASVL